METMVKGFVTDEKTMIFGCGPRSLRDTLANACAHVQRRVLKGELRAVEMHLEELGGDREFVVSVGYYHFSVHGKLETSLYISYLGRSRSDSAPSYVYFIQMMLTR